MRGKFLSRLYLVLFDIIFVISNSFLFSSGLFHPYYWPWFLTACRPSTCLVTLFYAFCFHLFIHPYNVRLRWIHSFERKIQIAILHSRYFRFVHFLLPVRKIPHWTTLNSRAIRWVKMERWIILGSQMLSDTFASWFSVLVWMLSQFIGSSFFLYELLS